MVSLNVESETSLIPERRDRQKVSQLKRVQQYHTQGVPTTARGVRTLRGGPHYTTGLHSVVPTCQHPTPVSHTAPRQPNSSPKNCRRDYGCPAAIKQKKRTGWQLSASRNDVGQPACWLFSVGLAVRQLTGRSASSFAGVRASLESASGQLRPPAPVWSPSKGHTERSSSGRLYRLEANRSIRSKEHCVDRHRQEQSANRVITLRDGIDVKTYSPGPGGDKAIAVYYYETTEPLTFFRRGHSSGGLRLGPGAQAPNLAPNF